MNKNCPHCHIAYEVEPGFFFGAAYISYAFNIALLFITSMITYTIIEKPSMWHFFQAVLISIVIFTPFIYRFSRIIWIYWMSGIKYDEYFS